jgi:hypothetical protein
LRRVNFVIHIRQKRRCVLNTRGGVGFMDENREVLPETKADLEKAKPDRRGHRPSKTEKERVHRPFDSGYM